MAEPKGVEIDQFNGNLISRKVVRDAVRKMLVPYRDPAYPSDNDVEVHVHNETLAEVLDAIDEVPAVEAEPVRHGRWRFCGEDRWNDAFECSECGKIAMENSDYCPHCGAKMDGGNNVERIMDL